MDREVTYTEKGRAAIEMCGAPYYATIVPSRFKEPLLPWGELRNNRDGEHQKFAQRYWRMRPNADLSFVTGECSGGICVLDVDVKAGGADGWETIRDFEKTHGPLFDESIVSSKTGSGGSHIYFIDETGSLRGYTNPELGIDLRANGQMAVLPPSDHSSGGVYTWEVSPFEKDIETASPALKEFIEVCRPRPAKIESSSSNRLDRRVCEGGRNSMLFSTCCKFVRWGAPSDLVEILALGVNRRCCVPPLDDFEVLQVAGSAERYRKP